MATLEALKPSAQPVEVSPTLETLVERGVVQQRLRDEACEALKQTARSIEFGRKELSYVYAQTKGGTDVEHEIGECIALIRRAEKRLLEAFTELAQDVLPLE